MASSLIYAAVWLVAIAAAWDMVRMFTARGADARHQQLLTELDKLGQDTSRRLAELEKQALVARNAQKTPQSPLAGWRRP